MPVNVRLLLNICEGPLKCGLQKVSLNSESLETAERSERDEEKKGERGRGRGRSNKRRKVTHL